MAEGKDSLVKGLEDFEKEITCGVCQEHYEDPKTLPCGHYFCKQSIVNLSFQTVAGEPINCPECRTDVAVSKESANDLKTAFNINRLKDTYATLRQGYEEDVLKAKVTAEEKPKSCSKICDKHSDFLLLYCYDCEHFICRDCGLTSHKDHKFEYNTTAVPKKKEELLQSAQYFKEVEEDFEQAILKGKAMFEKMEFHKKAVEEFIQTRFTELQSILESCKEKLLKQNQNNIDKKLTNLKAQETKLSEACADLHSTIESIETHLSSFSDEDLLCMSSRLCKTILKKKNEYSRVGGARMVNQEKYWHFKLSPQEGTIKDINMMVPTKFKAYCDGLAQWRALEMWKGDFVCYQPMKISIDAGTNKEFYFYSKKLENFQCCLLGPRSQVMYDISQVGACTYHVNYTAPRQEGKYKIQILLDGKVLTKRILVVDLPLSVLPIEKSKRRLGSHLTV